MREIVACNRRPPAVRAVSSTGTSRLRKLGRLPSRISVRIACSRGRPSSPEIDSADCDQSEPEEVVREYRGSVQQPPDG